MSSRKSVLSGSVPVNAVPVSNERITIPGSPEAAAGVSMQEMIARAVAAAMGAQGTVAPVQAATPIQTAPVQVNVAPPTFNVQPLQLAVPPARAKVARESIGLIDSFSLQHVQPIAVRGDQTFRIGVSNPPAVADEKGNLKSRYRGNIVIGCNERSWQTFSLETLETFLAMADHIRAYVSTHRGVIEAIEATRTGKTK